MIIESKIQYEGLSSYDNSTALGPQLALCDVLRNGLIVANVLGGDHPWQKDNCSYGAIHNALEATIATMLRTQGAGPRQARKDARTIIDACIDSGENVTYCFHYLHNQGALSI